MDYFGAGKLHGIPWVSEQPAEDLDQEDQQDEKLRHYPAFNLADGVSLGANNEYVVKAVNLEQKMAEVISSDCSDLALANPSEAVPTGVSGDTDIGDMPEVTDAPAVGAGEVQGGGTES